VATNLIVGQQAVPKTRAIAVAATNSSLFFGQPPEIQLSTLPTDSPGIKFPPKCSILKFQLFGWVFVGSVEMFMAGHKMQLAKPPHCLTHEFLNKDTTAFMQQ